MIVIFCRLFSVMASGVTFVGLAAGTTWGDGAAGTTWGDGAAGNCLVDSGFGSGMTGLAGGGTFFTSGVVEGSTLAAVFWGRTVGVASGNDEAGFGAGKLLGSSVASSSCRACTTG